MAADPPSPPAAPTPARGSAPASESGIPQLSRRSFWFALGVTLAIFFLLHPMWRPLDMDAMDRNIGWSYAPIPLLTWGLLALERKLRWSSWALETIKLTFIKFAITFLFANAVWVFVGAPRGPEPPVLEAPVPEPPGRFEVREPPPPTPIDPARTGSIEGLVVDAAGAPRAGVLVAVTGGLDEIVFAPRPEGVVLGHGERGFEPARATVMIYERLVLRGVEEKLHTASATEGSGRQLFNVPLLPGTERALMFDRPVGRVTLKCTVHGEAEHAAELLVVSNPFAAWTAADGTFDFAGVPAGNLQLTVSNSSGAHVNVPVPLGPGATVSGVRVTLP